MHCGRFQPAPYSRRDMLLRTANGFGALALASLLREKSFGGKGAYDLQFPQRAKSVIFLYMDGGPSQVDTFDPKPLLTKHHGEEPNKLFKVEPTQFNNNGRMLGSPWQFSKHGESGLEISTLFPHVAQHADKLLVVRSMTSKFPEHTFANYFLHTGNGLQGRPSMGSWITYGLGSECDELPGFVVLNGGLIPPGGIDCFGSGFLPASYQGSILRPSGQALANVESRDADPSFQRRRLELLSELDRQVIDQRGNFDQVESAIANYEMAFRMQQAVPQLTDITDETQATRELYGLDVPNEPTRIFARECLLARRLVERGVRFIELTCPSVGTDRWDQHSGLVDGHNRNALAVDQPIAGLLADLEQRGLLDSTLVVWSGEFGRTPFAQGSDGRDHNPFAFTCWLAGGGTRGGMAYGESDEFGYKVIRDRVEMHDLHATMLYLLGVDHTKSTFRWGGRDMRLTDVHGNIMHDWVA